MHCVLLLPQNTVLKNGVLENSVLENSVLENSVLENNVLENRHAVSKCSKTSTAVLKAEHAVLDCRVYVAYR